MSPAPSTSAVSPLISPQILRASPSAAKLTDTAPSANPVSARTRLPTVNA
jgi:hypothetical protein